MAAKKYPGSTKLDLARERKLLAEMEQILKDAEKPAEHACPLCDHRSTKHPLDRHEGTDYATPRARALRFAFVAAQVARAAGADFDFGGVDEAIGEFFRLGKAHVRAQASFLIREAVISAQRGGWADRYRKAAAENGWLEDPRFLADLREQEFRDRYNAELGAASCIHTYEILFGPLEEEQRRLAIKHLEIAIPLLVGKGGNYTQPLGEALAAVGWPYDRETVKKTVLAHRARLRSASNKA